MVPNAPQATFNNSTSIGCPSIAPAKASKAPALTRDFFCWKRFEKAVRKTKTWVFFAAGRHQRNDTKQRERERERDVFVELWKFWKCRNDWLSLANAIPSHVEILQLRYMKFAEPGIARWFCCILWTLLFSAVKQKNNQSLCVNKHFSPASSLKKHTNFYLFVGYTWDRASHVLDISAVNSQKRSRPFPKKTKCQKSGIHDMDQTHSKSSKGCRKEKTYAFLHISAHKNQMPISWRSKKKSADTHW